MTKTHTTMQPSDFKDFTTALTKLNDRAWRDHNEFLKTSGSAESIHIPVETDSGPNTLCGQVVSPTNPLVKPVAAYPESFRRDMEWCPYCLTKHYFGTHYERVRGRFERDDIETVDAAVVVADCPNPGCYHTRCCGAYPEGVRAPTLSEYRDLRECEYCRDSKRLRDRYSPIPVEDAEL